MMKNLKTAAVLIGIGLMTPLAQATLPLQPDTAIKVAPVVAMKAYPFSLTDVRLLDGPFKHAQDTDAKYLLELEPDRLLAGFREVAGLPAKAKRYGGWESSGVSGHILGHYLSACSMMYQSTGDERFKQRVAYCVDELALCQKANGNGFICGFSDGKRIFDQIANGTIEVANGLNGGWVPWYTLHKDFAGLRDAWLYTGNEKAKTVMIGFADWACNLADKLSEQQFQKMLGAEHGGMNEVMADIYSITGNDKYLALSERFNHKKVLDPLMNKVDDLTGLHANTQIPKVIGLAREYELTGDEKYHTGAEFFWDEVTGKRSFANGGNSNHEAFFPLGRMGQNLSVNSSETCNTYNMLKLTRHLFSWDPQASYADYLERALYNHILGSQDPISGGMTYYVPMESGRFKTFSSPFNSFWCCVGTGIENHSKYGGEIYFHDDNSLWVNLFIPSELNWEQKGLKIRQETNYPEDGTVKLTITAAAPTQAVLHIRRPAWAAGGVKILVEGGGQKTQDAKNPITAGTIASHENETISENPITAEKSVARFIDLDQTWKTGDVVTINLPMNIRAEPMPDDPSKVALFSGPVLLAADLGTSKMPPSQIAPNDQLIYARIPMPKVPVFIGTDAPADQWIKPVAGQPLTFKTVGVGKPDDVTLIPFYKANTERYAVYLDTYTPEEWQKKQAEIEAERQREATLAARTIDDVAPGEQQPEQDHNFKGHNTNHGTWAERGWRDAAPDGSFSYTLKVDPVQPTDLMCTYWGSDGGNRNFDIQIDGQTIATQKLNSTKPDQFFDVTYPIPPELTKGKQTVTVKFASHDGIVGGLFGCRTMKPS